jgi:hypothetical protein
MRRPVQVYICESLGLPEIAEFWMGIIRMNDSQKLRFSRRCLVPCVLLIL